MTYRHLYYRLPFFFQNMAITAYSYLLQRRYYGESYSSWCDVFDNQEFWTEGEIEQYQLGKLQQMVATAFQHVPHYRRAFDEGKVTPSALERVGDIRKFPILEKPLVRQDATSLLDERLDPESLVQDRTSGSTGTPMIIYWPRAMFPTWWALHERRVRAWAGVCQSMPRAMIGGRAIIKGESQGPYWRYNYLWKQLYMSSYHISNRTAAQYIDAIKRYGSQWITGYGSAIALLGEWLCHHPSLQPELKAAVTSGDNLLPGHRLAIEKGLGCKVFDYYGSAEGCLVISECEQKRMHLQPESGILEILDERGNHCQPGEVGEMIVTGLLNDAMPLIRYRTGDMASWSVESSCPCGRRSPLVCQIEGRADDYLLTEDGRKIGRISTAIKKCLTIHGSQIVQDSPGHAWLLIHPAEGYGEKDGELIKDDILSRIGSLRLDVRIVEALPKTPAGKQRLVVRLFDNPELTALYKKDLSDISWRC